MKPISWLAKAWQNEGVALKDWLRTKHTKVLILGGLPKYKKLANMTSRLALTVLLNDLLSLPDYPDRRVWLFLDELAALGHFDLLETVVTTGRSKGICVVIGIQDIGRIEHIYGREITKSLINSFATAVVLRCSDPATAQWASEALGEEETADFVSEHDNAKNPKSKSTNVRLKPIYLPSEIMNLPDLAGILRISNWPIPKITWPYKKIPNHLTLDCAADWTKEKVDIDEEPIESEKKDDDAPPPVAAPSTPNWKL
jgi:type IV secretory pathway TraG/TraD family ATPase VirD4